MSIQDDYFDLKDHLDKNGPKWAAQAFDRIWNWGVENENENEKLRPIVNGMRNAVRAMFEEEKGEDDEV